MKIKYLGTAAFEGVPALGCNCETCKRARELGGKNIRTRSQALIDDKLLIDFPPDTFLHTLYADLDLCKIDNCVITHSHSDHLYPQDVRALNKGYSAFKREKPFTFYVGESGYNTINAQTVKDGANSRAATVLVKPYEEFSVEGYDFLPIPAQHSSATSPFIYRIEKEGKSILYANDTGYFTEEMICALKKAGRIDLISLDATIKNCVIEGSHHMSYEAAVMLFKRFEKEGIADEKTLKVVNHFSHNNGRTYSDLVKIAKADGIVVSYDGLELKI